MFYETILFLGSLIGFTGIQNPSEEKFVQEEMTSEIAETSNPLKIQDEELSLKVVLGANEDSLLKTQEEESEVNLTSSFVNSPLSSVHSGNPSLVVAENLVEITETSNLLKIQDEEVNLELVAQRGIEEPSLKIVLEANESNLLKTQKEELEVNLTSALVNSPVSRSHSDKLSLVVEENLAEIQSNLASLVEDLPIEVVENIATIIKIFEESSSTHSLTFVEAELSDYVLEGGYYEDLQALDRSLARAQSNYIRALKKGLTADLSNLLKDRIDQVEANRRKQEEEIQWQIELLRSQSIENKREVILQNLQILGRVLAFGFNDESEEAASFFATLSPHDVDEMDPLKRHLLSSLPYIEHLVSLYSSGFVEEKIVDVFFQKNIRPVLIVLLKALDSDRAFEFSQR